MQCRINEMIVLESRNHDRLQGRVVGKVLAHLTQTDKGQVIQMDLSINSWANVSVDASASDIESALLLTADRILDRVISVARMDRVPTLLD